jgi:hypothetical protein
MTVTLQCKLCRASLLVAEGRAGQPMNCPRCGEQMIVPAFTGPAAGSAAGSFNPLAGAALAGAGSAAGPAIGSPLDPSAKDLNALRANMYPPGMEPPSAPAPRQAPAPPLLAPHGAFSGTVPATSGVGPVFPHPGPASFHAAPVSAGVPVASAPIASAPIASAPIASAPIASAPVVSAPGASAVGPGAAGAGGGIFNLAPPLSAPAIPPPAPMMPPPAPMMPPPAPMMPPPAPMMPPPVPMSKVPTPAPLVIPPLPPAASFPPAAAYSSAAPYPAGNASMKDAADAAATTAATTGATKKKPPKPERPAKPVANNPPAVAGGSAAGAPSGLPLGASGGAANSPTGGPVPVAGGTVWTAGPMPVGPPAAAMPRTSPPTGQPLPPPLPQTPPQPPPQPPARISQTARFVAADPSALRVQLGADGKLPELLLDDADKRAAGVAEEKPRSSPPWLLMGVFGLSIAMSLAMLFMDAEGTGGGGQRSQAVARAQLKQLYTGDYPPLAPYQVRVRQALQAFQKGDREDERRLLREVLDLLHAESKSRTTGITGMIEAPDPPIGNPSDRHLESLISTLLAE